MQGFTIIMASAGFLAIMFSSSMTALVIYLLGLVWFPQYLTINLGSIELNMMRILAFAMIAHVVFRTNLVWTFRWRLIDTAMVLFLAGRMAALAFNVPMADIIVHEGGFALDAVVPYFLARAIIRTREDLLRVIRALVVMSIPLGIFGIIQSTTGIDLMGIFRSGYASDYSGSSIYNYPKRLGLYRASAHFGIHIIFGLYFVMILPLVVNLTRLRGWTKGKAALAFSALTLGAASSVSSTPLLAFFVSIGALLMYPLRAYWRYLAIASLITIVSTELYSNRHWYETLSRFTLADSTSYYRIALIQEAFGGGMDGHWLAGYGLVGLNQTGVYAPWELKWNWVNKDLTNTYVSILANFGLMGLIPFLALMFIAFRKLGDAMRSAATRQDSILVWSLVAMLAGVAVSILTINILEQPRTLMYLFFGVAASMPAIIRVPARVPAPVTTPILEQS